MLTSESDEVVVIDITGVGGNRDRISDQLGWEAAYAELCFLDGMWPDFGKKQLSKALDDFQGRERRFGGLKQAV